jgi:hypothetical protein
MRRVRLMIGGLLMGLLLGTLAVWTGPGGMGRGSGDDPLIRGTRQVCEAILADDDSRWEAVRRRYFTGDVARTDLLKSARAQALLFGKESRIVSLRRSADGASGERQMAAVECLARTRSGDRILTLHWERERDAPWRISDILSAKAEGSPAGEALPAVAAPAPGKGKPRPRDH